MSDKLWYVREYSAGEMFEEAITHPDPWNRGDPMVGQVEFKEPGGQPDPNVYAYWSGNMVAEFAEEHRNDWGGVINDENPDGWKGWI